MAKQFYQKGAAGLALFYPVSFTPSTGGDLRGTLAIATESATELAHGVVSRLDDGVGITSIGITYSGDPVSFTISNDRDDQDTWSWFQRYIDKLKAGNYKPSAADAGGGSTYVNAMEDTAQATTTIGGVGGDYHNVVFGIIFGGKSNNKRKIFYGLFEIQPSAADVSYSANTKTTPNYVANAVYNDLPISASITYLPNDIALDVVNCVDETGQPYGATIAELLGTNSTLTLPAFTVPQFLYRNL